MCVCFCNVFMCFVFPCNVTKYIVNFFIFPSFLFVCVLGIRLRVFFSSPSVFTIFCQIVFAFIKKGFSYKMNFSNNTTLPHFPLLLISHFLLNYH